MKCESLKSEGTPGEEIIRDGARVITSTPYGFEDADEFILYLPGKLVSELPEEFLSWSHLRASDSVLPYYALYNVSGSKALLTRRDYE